MKLLPVFVLLLAMPMLSGCAIFGVAALGTVVAEGATADDSSGVSNGIVAQQWEKACTAVDGTVNPTSGDCDGDLFAYFFGTEDSSAPAEPAEPQAAQPQAAAPEPVYAEPQPVYAESEPAYAQPQPVESQPIQ